MLDEILTEKSKKQNGTLVSAISSDQHTNTHGVHGSVTPVSYKRNTAASLVYNNKAYTNDERNQI